MIESNLDSTIGQGHIVVCPNRSAHWQRTKLWLWCISTVALLISVGFALAGLWLILPFAGFEVMALVFLTSWVAHQCHRQQVIYIDDGRVLVEKGRHAPKVSWEAELFWARLVVDPPVYRGHPNKLFLRSKQQKIEIGEFLNEQDKKRLVAELRGMIHVVS